MRKSLLALLALLMLTLLPGCGRKAESSTEEKSTGRMELQYAKNFSVEYYQGAAARLRIGDQEFLLVSQDAAVPKGLEKLKQIKIPAENIYLASSSVPDLFVQMDALDTVSYLSTAEDNWNIPEVKEALENESLYYIGKYSSPDYELLLTEGCGLVVENTMILHSPATREKLEALGFPVLVEYSSYEPHPLGRVEWVKLYGLLCGKLPEAEAFFEKQTETFQSVANEAPTGKTAAFFHLSANGGVTVRRREDYVTRMIELAGAQTAVTELPEEENALSSATIQMEAFYEQAREADVLIYNSTVAGEVGSMESFCRLSPLFADFKAVKDGNVWTTDKSMFQRSSGAAEIIRELHAIFSGSAGDSMQYLYRVK